MKAVYETKDFISIYSEKHPSKLLSDFVFNLRYKDLPQEAIEQTKLYIADYYAACFAGKKVNGKFNKAVEEILFENSSKGVSSVLNSEKKLSSIDAAYLNAVYAHGADMDDGNRKAMGHVAAHVMSTAFSVGEEVHATGKELFTAINAGYEVYNRVAASVQPGLVYRGFHSTGTAGAIACGAVAAKLLKLDSDGIYNAMSLSSVQAGGLIIIAESGQCCKPINPANACRVGIMSAKLVEKGVESPRNPLESKKGWFHAMSDTVDVSMITENLGKTFTICESYLKPYPSCRHTHCGIDAAICLHDKIKGKEIKKIILNIYNNAIQIAGQIKIPVTPEDSKFSIHYSLATALLKGHFNLDDLDLKNVSDELISVINKIEFVADDSMENRDQGIRGSKVTVILENGESYSETVLIPKGDAANPFSWDDMKGKMESCMVGFIDSGEIPNVINKIKTLDFVSEFSINSVLK